MTAGHSQDSLQMSEQYVDHVLAELAEVVRTFQVEYMAVDSLADRLDDEVERMLEARIPRREGRGPTVPEPRRTLLSLRRNLAQDSASQYREVFRALVAWWADAAMVAVLFAAHGRRPDAVRIAAGDPYSWMTAGDLEHLPAIPDYDRSLAELSLSLITGPALPGDPFNRFAAQTQEHIESLGLAVRTGADGHARLVEDGRPEARRRRLWGTDWQEHRMPLLVETSELTEFLTRRGVPAETVDAISEVSTAAEAAREAKIRIDGLEAQLQADELSGAAKLAAMNEVDEWMIQPDVTDDRLIAYAQTLTASLPVIRGVCRSE